MVMKKILIALALLLTGIASGIGMYRYFIPR